MRARSTAAIKLAKHTILTRTVAAFATLGVMACADSAKGQDNDRFGAAFEGAAQIGRPVAQFECEFRDEIVFGLPVMGQPTRPYLANITVHERGHAVINGTVLEPEVVRPLTLSEDAPLEAAMYDAKQTQLAAKGSTNSLSSVPGLSDTERAAMGMAGAFGNTVLDMMLDGRERFFTINLETGFRFFDLDADHRPQNVSVPNCYRLL